jgi:two-component system sensor histidine kinase/response regulator
LGLIADVANNGREALQQLQRGRYSLLITDLHMPEMDGYELTFAIRQSESADRRFPIIAFTANALKGERARCLQAGMDDYVSKPVQTEVLKSVLDKWLPPAAQNEGLVTPVDKASADSQLALAVLDIDVLVSLVGGDRILVEELISDYRRAAEKAAAEIRAAIPAAEWEAVGAVAHRLKSSSRSVGALAMGEICERLEQAGRSGDGTAVQALIVDFETALKSVIAAIEQRDIP